MIKVVSLELLVGGAVLLLFGIHESNSLNSDISRLFTGSAADKAIWMIIGGAVCLAQGIIGFLFIPKKS